MSDPTIAFLSSQGIDLSEKDLKHYGVKGMKWGKKKGSEVSGGGGGDDPLFDETTVGFKIIEGGPQKKVFNASTGKYEMINSGPPVAARTTSTRQGKVNKFIEKLFDHKVGVGNPDNITRNKPPRSVIKQGIVNKFIQGCFDKLHKK